MGELSLFSLGCANLIMPGNRKMKLQPSWRVSFGQDQTLIATQQERECE